jgi:Ca2+-binding RTX toxin-like protein
MLTATYTGATIDLGAGDDYVFFASSGTATISNVEHIVGGAGVNNITLLGSQSTNVDLGTGDDVITLGNGVDEVLAGSGADRFIFTAISQSTTAVTDIFGDFTVGTDDLVFDGLLTGTFTYLGNAGSFSATGNSQAYFDNASDKLFVDTNGNGTTDMVIKLTGVSYDDMTTSDFIWS